MTIIAVSHAATVKSTWLIYQRCPVAIAGNLAYPCRIKCVIRRPVWSSTDCWQLICPDLHASCPQRKIEIYLLKHK